MAFQGGATVTLDDKGRVAIPARHREALKVACNGNIVLTAHPHRCLILIPEGNWPATMEKLTALPSYMEESSLWRRVLVGHAEAQQIDSAGRILISPLLRKYAALDKRVTLVGQVTYFELWDEAAWERVIAGVDTLKQKGVPPGMEKFAL